MANGPIIVYPVQLLRGFRVLPRCKRDLLSSWFLHQADWHLLTFQKYLPVQSSKVNQYEASITACPLQIGPTVSPDTPITASGRGVNIPEEGSSKAILRVEIFHRIVNVM